MERETTWRSSRLARLLGGMAIYTLAFWGGWGILSVAGSFLEQPEIPHFTTAILVLFGVLHIGALVLVYRIGVWIGSRWWLLSPVLVIILPAYYIPTLGQTYLGWPSDSGWMYVFIIALIYALLSLFAAGLGIEAASWRADASPALAAADRSPASWAALLTLAGAVLMGLGLMSDVGLGFVIGLFLFVAGALASGAWTYLWPWW